MIINDMEYWNCRIFMSPKNKYGQKWGFKIISTHELIERFFKYIKMIR